MPAMPSFSEAASLGIHAMALLAASGERSLTNKEMADSLDASGAHLSKVLQRLGKLGYVRAIRGPKGGFSLAARAADLNLRDVFEAVEGKLDLTSCLMKGGVCIGEDCILSDVVQKVNDQVLKYLTSTRLSDLDGAFSAKGAAKTAVPKRGGRA